VVLAVTVLGTVGGLAAALTSNSAYTSESVLLLTPVNTATGLPSNDYLESRAQAYAAIASSGEFLDEVRLATGGSVSDDLPDVSSAVPTDTSLVRLIATADSAAGARTLAQTSGELLIGRSQVLDTGAGGTPPLSLQQVSAPQEPAQASSTSRSLLLLAGVLAGIVLGCALAVARERQDDRIYDAASLAGVAGPTLVEVLPRRRGPGSDRETAIDALLIREVRGSAAPVVLAVESCAGPGRAGELADELARRAVELAVGAVRLHVIGPADPSPDDHASSRTIDGILHQRLVAQTTAWADVQEGVARIRTAVGEHRLTILTVESGGDLAAGRAASKRTYIEVRLGTDRAPDVQRIVGQVWAAPGTPALLAEGDRGTFSGQLRGGPGSDGRHSSTT